MKNLKTILGIFLIYSSVSYSQLPQSYPYKSVIDQYGYIYMTGDTTYPDGSKDFVMKRFNSQGTLQSRFVYINSFGDDRGFDVVVGENSSYYYGTGFVINQLGSAELIVAKINKISGDSDWVKRYSDVEKYESRGLGIALDNDGNIYITGYIKNKFMEKMFSF